ncbi:MAG: hypothetical protein U9Q27_02310 [Patescibacteria group bacterium]|nr:hypothetical protein [Patescibacteria group bacterium]
MACWLVEQWEKKNDIRAQKENRYQLAADIAAGKGRRINVDDCVPVTTKHDPLADFSLDELLWLAPTFR